MNSARVYIAQETPDSKEKDFSGRLLVGSDEFIGIPGKTREQPQSFEETWAFVRQLPADVLKKVGSENAAKLYNLK